MSKRTRNCFFTINNYNKHVLKALDKYAETKDCVSYLVYGLEIGEKEQTPHIQGYVEWNTKISWGAFNKSVGLKKGGKYARCADREGTAKEAAGYCKKGETLHSAKPSAEDGGWAFFYETPHATWDGKEFGKCSNQGRRGDLEAVCEQLKKGEIRVRDILLENPVLYHQYGRMFNAVEAVANESVARDFMTKGLWLSGTTGSGKSRAVYEKILGSYHPDTHYTYPYDGGWCDGYRGQELFIINEYRKSREHAPAFNQLLDMIDRYPYVLRRRGMPPVPFMAKMVVITSPLTMADCFVEEAMNDSDSLAQLERRIVEIRLDDRVLSDEQKQAELDAREAFKASILAKLAL